MITTKEITAIFFQFFFIIYYSLVGKLKNASLLFSPKENIHKLLKYSHLSLSCNCCNIGGSQLYQPYLFPNFYSFFKSYYNLLMATIDVKLNHLNHLCHNVI